MELIAPAGTCPDVEMRVMNFCLGHRRLVGCQATLTLPGSRQRGQGVTGMDVVCLTENKERFTEDTEN